MTEETKALPATKKPAGKTKAAAVAKLLTREKGATLDEMMKTTSWQAHSCRAFLTGLRKKGRELVKEQRADGKVAYRLVETPAPAPQPEPQA